jgi:hypothetical protein
MWRLGHPRRPDGPLTQVAVVVPEQNDWEDFRQGIFVCARKGLVALGKDEPASVVVSTSSGRAIRFTWCQARGSLETRNAVRRLLAGRSPPIACVGSANTALTIELALALGEAGAAARPLLLLPWATSNRATVAAEPVRLLDLLPGRMFRFCPSNREVAELAIDCVMREHAGRDPGRILMAIDSADPYSIDLAAAFRAAIEARGLAPPIESLSAVDGAPAGVSSSPTASEARRAEQIWRAAGALRAGRSVWVLLPFQEEPARRLLEALATSSKTAAGLDPHVEVVCGDGIGLERLWQFAGVRGLRVWCVTPATVPRTGESVSDDSQISAEVVAALALALDRAHTPNELRDALIALEVGPHDRAASGRPIDLTASGERAGQPIGLVLGSREGRAQVLAFARDADGRWLEPTPIEPPTIVSRR